MPNLGPIFLDGRTVRLEPLRPSHAAGLLAAGQTSPDIWTWLPAVLTTAEAVDAFIASAQQSEAAGTDFVFAVLDRATGRVLGSTRYMDVSAANRGAEIGWTWYARDVWATAVNPECKFLLLRHAFEQWGAMRMQLKADACNERSRAAILRLGAQFEGILRKHRFRRDGTVRDTAMYSILDTEWPAVKEGLLRRLQQA